MQKSVFYKLNINITAVAIAVLVIIGALFGVYIFKGQTDKTITASGNSQMSVMPDEAVVYLLIETRNLSAEGTKDQNAVISEKVLSELAKIGIEKKDIQTENYNIYPEYDWLGGMQKLKGYVASNYIKVTSKDFDNVGKVVDVSVDAGSLVNYINFELSNEKINEYKTLALMNASQDAKKKAEAIIAGLGKKLGGVVSASAPEYNYMPYPIYRMEEAGASSMDVKQVATNIQPKNVEVFASVNVVYEIR